MAASASAGGTGEVLRPDICVIGAGSGGLSVAAAAAAFGVPVVLIEHGRMGGDCLNVGCVPSKALIAAGTRAHQIATADRFGIAATADPAFARIGRHVRDVIAAVAPNDSAERFAGLGVRVIRGSARFADAATVTVNDLGIKARRFVIATGSSPAVPDIPGLAAVPYLTNATVFALRERPSHLVVLGAGPVGLELAQAFRRLGSRVTVIEAQRPLAHDDPECARVVIDALVREGVEILAAATVKSAAAVPDGVRLAVVAPSGAGAGITTITGSHLLIATGRTPNVDLALASAGIVCGPHGIAVDHGLRTSNRRVYAIGDVIGGMRFTHVANYHAGLVIRNALFRLPVRVSYTDVPRVTFTDPELAQVGLGEDEARRQGHRIRVLRWPFLENDRAHAVHEHHGHVKVVTQARGRILGATIVGPHAGELIAPWTLAIRQRLNIRAMAEVVAPYPTLGEVNKRAAMSFFSPRLAGPGVRRIVRWLRRLG